MLRIKSYQREFKNVSDVRCPMVSHGVPEIPQRRELESESATDHLQWPRLTDLTVKKGYGMLRFVWNAVSDLRVKTDQKEVI